MIAGMDWKLEVIVVPVTDVDRAKRFYSEQAGFVVDVDRQISDSMRIVQLTPPGSACSVVTVLDDIGEAHRQLTERGVAVTPIRHMEDGSWVEGKGDPWNSFVSFEDPDGNAWTVQERG
jgi:predicted enzyme related to lactoylglutathione lyase